MSFQVRTSKIRDFRCEANRDVDLRRVRNDAGVVGRDNVDVLDDRNVRRFVVGARFKARLNIEKEKEKETKKIKEKRK